MKKRNCKAIFIAAIGTTWKLADEGWVAVPAGYLSKLDVEDFLENYLCMKKTSFLLDMQMHVGENLKSTQIFCEGSPERVEQIYFQCFDGGSAQIKEKFFASRLSSNASLFEPRDGNMFEVGP